MTLLNANIHGVYSIAVTPFLPSGEVDVVSIDRMVDFYHACGVNGLTILGVMGEAQKLDLSESIAASEQIIRRSRIPVIVGVSASGFASMRALARTVMDIGAAGVMIAPPSTLRTDDQILSYYRQAVEAIGADIPFVVQDYPLVTGVIMTADVIRRIVEQCPSCVMLKHEDWPGLEKITALRAFQQGGSMAPLSILTGNGGLFLNYEMERGADGAMTGYCFPEMLVDIVTSHRSGRRDEMHDLFDAHLPLIRYEQQPSVGLAVRKYVLMRRGVIAHDTQRSPGNALGDKARSEVDYILDRLQQSDSRTDLSCRALA